MTTPVIPQIKRSNTPGAQPTGLISGELAYNSADKKLFTTVGTQTGTTVITLIDGKNTDHANIADVANSVAGSNVSGQVSSAASADVALSVDGANVVGEVAVAAQVSGATQANITSVGTLVSLDVSGAVSASTVETTTNGAGTNFKVGDDAYIGDVNRVNTLRVTGIQDATQGYIIFGNGSNAALGRSGTGALTYGGNIQADYFIGNGSALTGVQADSVALANVVGAGNIAAANFNGNGSQFLSGNGTFQTISTTSIANGTTSVSTSATQAVITTEGTTTLTASTGAVSIAGNVSVTGNLNVTGNLSYDQVTNLEVQEPLIFTAVGNPGDAYDQGLVATYNAGSELYAGISREHGTGYWKLFDGLATLPTTTIDFANSLPTTFVADTIVGDLHGTANVALEVAAANVTGLTTLIAGSTVAAANVAYSVSAANVSGLSAAVAAVKVDNATHADVADSANSVAVANVVGFSAAVANVKVNAATVADSANSVAAANVSGLTTLIAGSTVAAANVAYSVDGANVSGAVATATQALSVSTDVANLVVTGGSSGQFMITDGAGALSFATLVINADAGTF